MRSESLPVGSSEGRLERGGHQDMRKIWAIKKRLLGMRAVPCPYFNLERACSMWRQGNGSHVTGPSEFNSSDLVSLGVFSPVP